MLVRGIKGNARRHVVAAMALLVLPGLAGCSQQMLDASVQRSAKAFEGVGSAMGKLFKLSLGGLPGQKDGGKYKPMSEKRLKAVARKREKAIVAWLAKDRKIAVEEAGGSTPTARYWAGPRSEVTWYEALPSVLLSEVEGAGAAAAALDGYAAMKSARDKVAAVARDRTDHTVFGKPSPAPDLPGQDAVLVVGLPVLGLVGVSDHGPDPDVALRIRVGGKLNAPAGWFYGDRFVYESDPRRLGAWVADDAELLRNELAIAIEDLAGQIVDELLLPGKSRESARIQGTEVSF